MVEDPTIVLRKGGGFNAMLSKDLTAGRAY